MTEKKHPITSGNKEMPVTSKKIQRLSKEDAILNWLTAPRVNPAEVVGSIPYKYRGSRFGMNCLRIDGTRDWIDSVLSNLKSLIQCENSLTRIEIQYQEIADRETKEPTGKWVCYVRISDRGDSRTTLLDRINLN
tara:strand:+ start:541 stop:945 length:405 start_codon:yes stop_codon:yes gene_type:complete